ncbi:membrane protein [Gordonia phage VanLee]|uniref:Membrane protein n=1 Tax=Gordonia phage VanLee TaxID=2845816 RepID=A0A8F2DA54_9CAUD|nr:membrane protein [Gordonia phage VanLee]QWS68149.1 membrane protein [Gordonia phage VanLee]
MPPEIAQYLPEWSVVLVVVAVALNYFGRMLSEASESWAKALGPLGKRWRERGIRRAEERRAVRQGRLDELDDMERDRDYFKAKQRKTEDRLQLLEDDYLSYDAAWHRQVRLQAIDAGCELPEHIGYIEWLRKKGKPADRRDGLEP